MLPKKLQAVRISSLRVPDNRQSQDSVDAKWMDKSNSACSGSEFFLGERGPFLPATPSFPPPSHLLHTPVPKRRRSCPVANFDAERHFEPLPEMLGNRHSLIHHLLHSQQQELQNGTVRQDSLGTERMDTFHSDDSGFEFFSKEHGPALPATPSLPPPPHLLRFPSANLGRSVFQGDFDRESNLQLLREILGILKQMLASLNSFEKDVAARVIEDHLHHQMASPSG